MKKINYVPKVWGYEKWLVNNDLYCGKELCVMRDSACSFHYHREKRETFYIQSGKMLLLMGRYPKDFEGLAKSDNDTSFYVDENGEISFNFPGYQYDSNISTKYTNYGLTAYLINLPKIAMKAKIHSYVLRAGDSIDIPLLTPHLFYGIEQTTFIEISTHHEDSDSYKLTDSF